MNQTLKIFLSFSCKKPGSPPPYAATKFRSSLVRARTCTAMNLISLSMFRSVSYTHLTLPTIYSV